MYQLLGHHQRSQRIWGSSQICLSQVSILRWSSKLNSFTWKLWMGWGTLPQKKKEMKTNPFLESVSYSASSRSIFVYFCNYHRWFLGDYGSKWLQSMAPTSICLFVGCRGFIHVCSDHWLPSSLANMKMGHQSCQTWNLSSHLLPASLVCQNANKIVTHAPYSFWSHWVLGHVHSSDT